MTLKCSHCICTEVSFLHKETPLWDFLILTITNSPLLIRVLDVNKEKKTIGLSIPMWFIHFSIQTLLWSSI